MTRKKKGNEPDGRTAIVLTRADCRAILTFVAQGTRLPATIRRRLSSPLLTRTARHQASFATSHQGTTIHLADRHPDVVAALDGGDTEILVAISRVAAERFEAKDKKIDKGPLSAGDVAVRPLDPHKTPAPGRGARVVSGGAPGLGRRAR